MARLVTASGRRRRRGGAAAPAEDVARSFVAGYVAAREGLRTLGILCSERSVQSDYAEWPSGW
jgi:hypothetical protein